MRKIITLDIHNDGGRVWKLNGERHRIKGSAVFNNNGVEYLYRYGFFKGINHEKERKSNR
jgi:hypothetical protein